MLLAVELLFVVKPIKLFAAEELWLKNWAGGVIVLMADMFMPAVDEFDWRTQIVFSFCQTKTLCTIAAPQKKMPTPIRTLVIIAGVD